MAGAPLRPPATVDEYLARAPPRFRDTLQQLRRTIQRVAPEAEELISYQMPAFREHGMLVYYAAFSDHCSLYVGSPEVRARFSSELQPFAAGKGTLRFTPEHPLPADLVQRIVTVRLAENAERYSRTRRSPRSAGGPGNRLGGGTGPSAVGAPSRPRSSKGMSRGNPKGSDGPDRRQGSTSVDEDATPARLRFAKLVQQLAVGDGADSPHREGFGVQSLFVGRKMFRLLSDSGGLVLKLPPARVQELIAAGLGSPWRPGTGKALSEYVAIGLEHQSRRLPLAKQSREYMRSKG